MIREKLVEKINIVTIFALASVTLTIAPFSVTHPFSLPKLIPLVGLSFLLMPLLALVINKNFLRQFRAVSVLVVLNLLVIIVVLFMSNNNLTQKFYGLWGSSNGFLTHFSYLLLLTSSLFLGLSKNLDKLRLTCILLGWIVLIYGYLQAFSLVEIQNITGFNNRSISFFGNTNYHSAFIGMMCAMNLSLYLSMKGSKVNKFLYFIYIPLGLYGIYLAKSEQGYLVFATGAAVAIYAYLRSSNRHKISSIFLVSAASALILILAGFFQRGPLSRIVYQDTISFRGYYWRTGIEIFKENFWFGAGFDSYRDWYRRFREEQSLIPLGPTDIADSAHSYFIDTAVNGGIFLITLYLMLVAYTLKCILIILKNLKNFEPFVSAILSLWFAFTTQQFLSLPQPGIVIWGWVLSGLIISISKRHSPEITESLNQKVKNNSIVVTSALLSFSVGLVMGILPNSTSNSYRTALEQQDPKKLIKAATTYPNDSTMLVSAGAALIGIGDFTSARKILKIATEEYPEYYESWYIYSLLPNLPETEIQKIRAKMELLEPILGKEKVHSDQLSRN
jgi:O-Antigen ligase